MRLLSIIKLCSILLCAVTEGRCQASGDTLRLTLAEVVAMAKGRSIASRQAATVKETKYWQWRTFKSNYQPQLAVSGTLPAYSRTYT
jgi:outer membrane protein